MPFTVARPLDICGAHTIFHRTFKDVGNGVVAEDQDTTTHELPSAEMFDLEACLKDKVNLQTLNTVVIPPKISPELKESMDIDLESDEFGKIFNPQQESPKEN